LKDWAVIEEKTCIRFVQRTYQADYLEITKGAGCDSFVGKVTGKQVLNLGEGCVAPTIPAHEMIHALGFNHMQNDQDRDNFITVHPENVSPEFEFVLGKVDPKLFGSFNTPYDLRSIMHYGKDAFSVNGLNTIVPLDPAFLDIIGNSPFSEGDATRLNNMYQCK
jgi:choriolysin H